MNPSVLVTCEHASNSVPASYAALFHNADRALDTHVGYDQGAVQLARAISRRLRVPLFEGGATRLLIDLNRSPGHRARFSGFTAHLPPADKKDIEARYYLPYRRAVEAAARAAGPVVHVSVHSFTPRLAGQVRQADVGLLYDPARARERALCAAWKGALEERAPTLRVRRNYPYRGTADGFGTYLRRRLPANRYACVELEVNQALLGDRTSGARASRAIVTSLANTLAQLSW